MLQNLNLKNKEECKVKSGLMTKFILKLGKGSTLWLTKALYSRGFKLSEKSVVRHKTFPRLHSFSF